MTSSMIPLRATTQQVTTLECAPCALRCAMQQRGHHAWTPPLADLAVDIVAGALTLCSATEVLVPSSLVHFMETHRRQARSSTSPAAADVAWPWPAWDAALRERRLVTWVTAQDAPRLLRSDYGHSYSNWCVPVPAGPLVAQLDFGQPMDVFYHATLPALLDAVSAHRDSHRVRWRAWMRSALTCTYEGLHVPPIRVSDSTSQLLRQDGGCERVIWEAAVKGLTPRWLETAAKTALAVGIAPSSLALALPEESSCTARLLAKSAEVGITSWTTCALPSTALYPRTDPIATPQSIHVFTTGWNELSEVVGMERSAEAEAADAEREASLARCADFVDAVQEQCATLLATDADGA